MGRRIRHGCCGCVHDRRSGSADGNERYAACVRVRIRDACAADVSRHGCACGEFRGTRSRKTGKRVGLHGKNQHIGNDAAVFDDGPARCADRSFTDYGPANGCGAFVRRAEHGRGTADDRADYCRAHGAYDSGNNRHNPAGGRNDGCRRNNNQSGNGRNHHDHHYYDAASANVGGGTVRVSDDWRRPAQVFRQ